MTFGATKSWMQDIDSLRLEAVPHVIEMTAEQKELLEYSRTGPRKVSFSSIAKVWNKQGWGKVSASYLQKRFSQMKEAD